RDSSIRACSLVIDCRKGSDYHYPVVGTVELQVVVEVIDEIEAVLGEERQDGVGALLQSALGEDQAIEGSGIMGRAGAAAHRFAPRLALDFAELVLDLA